MFPAKPPHPTFSRREKESPLLLGEDGGEGNPSRVSEQSAKGAAVPSTTGQVLIFITSHSATAPEITRTNVKLAASILVCFSAARQRSELLAKAIIANSVRRKTRATITH